MRTFIHREFATYDENGNVENVDGDIQISFMENNIIRVLVCRLHNGAQAIMIIKYCHGLDLYDISKKILEKICKDLHCDDNYKDFIINVDLSGASHDGWIIDKEIETNWGGDIWLHFTRENVSKYITINPLLENYNKSKIDGYKNAPIIIRGEIDSSCNFTYDYPIISSNSSMDTYKKSRSPFL